MSLPHLKSDRLSGAAFWRRLVFFLSVGVTLPAGIASAADGFPPLVAPSTTRAMPGKFVHAQLTIPDIAQAEHFYGQLLGWTFRDVPVPVGHYALATLNGQNVASLIERPTTRHRVPLWLPFISTTSVDDVVLAAQSWGGKIMFPAHDIPGIGREAIITDAQGGLFAAIRSSSGDAEDSDVPAIQGQWIWSALLTRAPKDAAGFYQKLFAYEVRAQDETQAPPRYVLSSQSSPRATINPLPPHVKPDAPSLWLNFVNVDSVADIVGKAVELGGHVIAAPHLDHNNSLIAVLTDPAGAVFGVMEAGDAAQGAPK